MSIIPVPAHLEERPGELALPVQINIGCKGKGSLHVGAYLQRHLSDILHLQSTNQETINEEPSTSGCTILLHRTGKSVGARSPSAVASEVYELDISEAGVLITAQEAHGLFNGVQSLVQLLPPTPMQENIRLSCLKILDGPRFWWRGVLLDVGRHYFSVPFIKKFLDVMALHKCNVFHWHLTEDQGWRLELKGFPRLSEFGAWRMRNGKPYGGYYSQEEVREIVEYAAQRFIEVVPEIELPGHCGAALASYPYLGCTGRVTQVPVHWGVHEDVYCAGKESTFDFLEAVLKEVMELFPSRYIHIGGDECPKSRWHRCPHCQQRIQDNGLLDEYELQSWFIGRINQFLIGQGKQLIGWDEILEGGLAEGAIVMSWRGITGGVRAARGGHDVIMTPTSHCYFDYKQSLRPEEPGAWYAMLPLEVCYAFDPLPPEPMPDPRCAAAQALPPAIHPAAPPVRLSSGDSGAMEESDSTGVDPMGDGADDRPSSSVVGSTVADLSSDLGAEMEVNTTAAAHAADWTLPAADASRIIGGQANVWTEYIADEETVEYMLLPRLCATAETLWSPKHTRDWPGFQLRLKHLMKRFDALDLRYRPLV